VNWAEWNRGIEVEPSLYASDFSRLGEEVEGLLDAGTRVFHFDVGDGHFIPPITMGPIVLQRVTPLVHAVGGALDCHLMVESPERHIEQFAEAGADSVTVHVETCPDLPGVVGLAREHGLQAGVALNPDTSVEQGAAAALKAEVDVVLCMSVHPGYSGQKFIPDAFERVRAMRELLPESIQIQVDGGVGLENIAELREAGATLFIAGASIFGHDDRAAAYRALVEQASQRT
jgi:ribulose-phosphate 3-epimerase